MQAEKSFTPEESSSVRKIEYDSTEQWLDVTYKTGKTYRYSMFPEHKWNRAVDSHRIGEFINDEVKGIHPYKLLN